MPTVCFYFQVHQPYRLRRYSVFDVGRSHHYFDDAANEQILRKVASKCYLPMNRLLRRLIDEHEGRFKIAFSLTGTLLDQLEQYSPETLASFQDLVSTGCVELLAETDHHSLSFLYDRDEFDRQVDAHGARVQALFGVRPRVFRNTELIFDNTLASHLAGRGFAAALAEGADRVLGWRSPCFVYDSAAAPELRLLLKSYRLSDDIAFRFGDRAWSEHPLSVERFASWVGSVNGNGQVVNLFMDYETFGEHQWAETGIFEFMRALPGAILAAPDSGFMTPSEVVATYAPLGALDVPETISWADAERDLSAWLGNDMQRVAGRALYDLGPEIHASGDEEVLRDFRRLTTSDHLYYMCTKYFADGDVHRYFNPYDSPYEAYISFMNVLNDLALRIGCDPEGEPLLVEEPARRQSRPAFAAALAARSASPDTQLTLTGDLT